MHKRKGLIVVLGILIIALLLLVNFIQRKYAVAILMYHSINPAANYGDRFSETPYNFERQMSLLKKLHYNVITLEELAILIKDKKMAPPHTIAITLDDNHKEYYIYALPILKKYGLPATIFILVNSVGMPNKLTWNEIRIMQDSGIITFGSHTLTHPYLTKSGPEKLRKEIFDSKKILENKLKRKVNAFSYPYGDFNYKARQLVIEAGYKLAVAADPGKEYPSDDIFALKRLEVPKNARNLLVFWLEISGFYNWADYISSSTAGKLKSYYARFISKR